MTSVRPVCSPSAESAKIGNRVRHRGHQRELHPSQHLAQDLCANGSAGSSNISDPRPETTETGRQESVRRHPGVALSYGKYVKFVISEFSRPNGCCLHKFWTYSATLVVAEDSHFVDMCHAVRVSGHPCEADYPTLPGRHHEKRMPLAGRWTPLSEVVGKLLAYSAQLSHPPPALPIALRQEPAPGPLPVDLSVGDRKSFVTELHAAGSIRLPRRELTHATSLARASQWTGTWLLSVAWRRRPRV